MFSGLVRKIFRSLPSVISGSSQSASIVVRAADTAKIQLVFNGLQLTNPNGPALYIAEADKVVVTLAKNTDNKLADGERYASIDNGTALDAALFSKADLALNGTGSLTVNGNFKHGLVSKDDLVITGGKLTVNAARNGLEGKDCVKIGGGEIQVSAGADGVRSDNDTDAARGYVYISGGVLTVAAGNDAVQAETVLKIEGGEVYAQAGDGCLAVPLSSTESYKGLKAGSDLLLAGGKARIDASDDALHADGNVLVSAGEYELLSGSDAIHCAKVFSMSDGTINVKKAQKDGVDALDVLQSGGELRIQSDGDAVKAAHAEKDAAAVLVTGGRMVLICCDDGIDVDGRFAITGGLVLIQAIPSTDPDGGLNRGLKYQTSATVTGGTLISLEKSTDAPKHFTQAANQGAVLISVGERKADGAISLCDGQGKALLSLTPTRDDEYSSLLITSPSLSGGVKLNLVFGGTLSDADADGFAENATLTGGEPAKEIEMSEALITVSLIEAQK